MSSPSAPDAFLAQVLAWRGARRRLLLAALSAATIGGASVWLSVRALGYRDFVAYAFSPTTAALDLGDVVNGAPQAALHNHQVALTGITEHRGLHLQHMPTPRLWPTDSWLYRLVGARGLFIEVKPDAERFAPFQAVRVVGRAVDPARDPAYGQALAAYRALFRAKAQPQARVVQVDVLQGHGRGACLALLGAWLTAQLAGLLAVRRLWRAWQALTPRPSP